MVTKLIDFIKSTAFIIGYLFAIATAYYLSFWGYFDIDVFQFMSVEDIIKGIAYPLRFADIGIIIIFLSFVSIYTAIGLTKYDKATRRGVLGILIFLIAPAAWELYYFKYSNASQRIGLIIASLLTLLLIVIYLVVNDGYEEDKKKAVAAKEPFTDEHPAISFRNIIVTFSLVFFPINAIIAGQADARDIHDSKRFNYVMQQDLPQEKIKIRFDFLIFLGAVSEKYIFLNKNEDERFVIDKSELPALRINHFDSSDIISVNHLAANLLAQSQNAKQVSDAKKQDVKQVPDIKK